jgi:LDH2 family malate/lactate/ureidoglycolate dehydrogenase
MDHWLKRFRSAKTVEGQQQVFVPGDIEREIEKQRRAEGIYLLEPVVKNLQSVAKRFDIEL